MEDGGVVGTEGGICEKRRGRKGEGRWVELVLLLTSPPYHLYSNNSEKYIRVLTIIIITSHHKMIHQSFRSEPKRVGKTVLSLRSEVVLRDGSDLEPT